MTSHGWILRHFLQLQIFSWKLEINNLAKPCFKKFGLFLESLGIKIYIIGAYWLWTGIYGRQWPSGCARAAQTAQERATNTPATAKSSRAAAGIKWRLWRAGFVAIFTSKNAGWLIIIDFFSNKKSYFFSSMASKSIIIQWNRSSSQF